MHILFRCLFIALLAIAVFVCIAGFGGVFIIHLLALSTGSFSLVSLVSFLFVYGQAIFIYFCVLCGFAILFDSFFIPFARSLAFMITVCIAFLIPFIVNMGMNGQMERLRANDKPVLDGQRFVGDIIHLDQYLTKGMDVCSSLCRRILSEGAYRTVKISLPENGVSYYKFADDNACKNLSQHDYKKITLCIEKVDTIGGEADYYYIDSMYRTKKGYRIRKVILRDQQRALYQKTQVGAKYYTYPFTFGLSLNPLDFKIHTTNGSLGRIVNKDTYELFF